MLSTPLYARLAVLGGALAIGCAGKASPSKARADEPPASAMERAAPNTGVRDEHSWVIAGTETKGRDSFVRVRYRGSNKTTVSRGLEVKQGDASLGTLHLNSTCSANAQGSIEVTPGAEWIIGPIDFAPGAWKECTPTSTQASSLDDVKLVATLLAE